MKRDPVVLVGIIEATLGVLVVFNVPGLSIAQAALVMAVVSAVAGLLQAGFGSETWLSLLLGAGRAVIMLAAGYGWAVSEGQIEALIALLAVVAGAYVRTQGTPLTAPTLRS